MNTSVSNHKRFVVGIDPGVEGACAIMLLSPNKSEQRIIIKDLKTLVESRGVRKPYKVPDIAALDADITKSLVEMNPDSQPLFVDIVLERPLFISRQAHIGKQFENFGMLKEALDAFASACNADMGQQAITVDLVAPNVWKMKLGVPADKGKVLEMARALFPSAVEYLKRKKDHNRADALLLAHYAAVKGWH